jgi:hypothetical protein
VSASEGGARALLDRGGSIGDRSRDQAIARQGARERSPALFGRTIDQILAVDVQAVEEEGREGQGFAQARDVEPPTEAPHRGLEGQRTAVGRSAIASPSSTICRTGRPRTARRSPGLRRRRRSGAG